MNGLHVRPQLRLLWRLGLLLAVGSVWLPGQGPHDESLLAATASRTQPAEAQACHGYQYDDGDVFHLWRSPGIAGDTLHAMRFTPLFACTLQTVSFWLGGLAEGMVGSPGATVSIYSSKDGLPDSLLASRTLTFGALSFFPAGPNVADFADLELSLADDFHVTIQRFGFSTDTMILLSDDGDFAMGRASAFWDLLNRWTPMPEGHGIDVNFFIRSSMCCTAPTGDPNDDGTVAAPDVVYLVNYIFKSGPEPIPCRPAGDVNCDGGVTAADLVYLVKYVFKSGPLPCDVTHLIAQGFYYCP